MSNPEPPVGNSSSPFGTPANPPQQGNPGVPFATPVDPVVTPPEQDWRAQAIAAGWEPAPPVADTATDPTADTPQDTAPAGPKNNYPGFTSPVIVQLNGTEYLGFVVEAASDEDDNGVATIAYFNNGNVTFSRFNHGDENTSNSYYANPH